MSLDIIITHPTHVDFPIWRYQISKMKELCDKIIVAFTPSNKKIDIKDSIKKALGEEITCIDTELESGKDWRNIAVNKSLEISNSKYVLFLEQDFIIHQNPYEFLLKIYSSLSNLVGFYEASQARLHPAFMYISRDLIEKTSKDFSAYPERNYDHFSLFCEELYGNNIKPTQLEQLGLLHNKDWRHLAGLTHNYALMMEGQKPNYKPDEFRAYNYICLHYLETNKIPMVPEFMDIIRKAAAQ